MLSFVQRFVTKLCTYIKQFGIVVNKYVQPQEIKETPGSTHPVNRRPSGKYKHTKLIKFTKMKHFYFVAALAAMASAAFTSCDKQNDVAPSQPESAILRFTEVTSLDVVTRADATDFTSDFKIFITNITAAEKVVTFSTPNWGFKDGSEVKVDRVGGELVAWAPETLPVVTADKTGVTYTLTAQKDAAAQDLIYQHQAVTSENANAIAVQMGHAYSKLSFKVVKGDGYNGEAVLAQVKITKGIYATGTLDMVKGEVTPVGEAVGTLTLAADEKALVVPTTNKPTISVTCTIDGETFTKDIAADTMPSLVAGTEYEITLTLVGQSAIISSVKEVPWSTTAVNGGDIS